MIYTETDKQAPKHTSIKREKDRERYIKTRTIPLSQTHKLTKTEKRQTNRRLDTQPQREREKNTYKDTFSDTITNKDRHGERHTDTHTYW